MTVEEIVGLYYDAWQAKRGDFSAVPLADDFAFTGPVGSFTDAAASAPWPARPARWSPGSPSVQQFIDGNHVCSIIDWEMALPVTPMTSAEILEVKDGKLVRGELIYDAQELRAAMTHARDRASGGALNALQREPGSPCPRQPGGAPGLTERKMFGGISFLIGGQMCCGVINDDVGLRLGADGADEALGEPFTRPISDFTGRLMKGYVYLAPGGTATAVGLGGWLRRAGCAFTESLPPKTPASRRARP